MSQITINPDGSVIVSQDGASTQVSEAPVASQRRGNFNQGQGGRNWRSKGIPGEPIANATLEFLAANGIDLGQLTSCSNAADTQPNTKPVPFTVTHQLMMEGGRSYPGNRFDLNIQVDKENTTDGAKTPSCNVLKVFQGPRPASNQAKDHVFTNGVRQNMLAREVQVGDSYLAQTYRRVKAETMTEDGVPWKLDIYVFSHYVDEAEASPEASE